MFAMAGCPQCGKHWPDDYQRCPEDGAALRASAMGMTSAAQTGAAVPALAPKSDEDLPAGSVAGEYRIEKKIGEGGMGSVYGARHPVIGKRAAIKVIRRELSTNPEAVDRFVLEAQSVNQIGHPNIVDVFGFGQLADGRSFFVMEWLEGESLRDRLQRPLAYPEALEILEQIAKALQAAHEAGVVHRDLKPDNVYLHARKGEKPSVKLLDFGLAKLTGATDSTRFDRTRTGMVMGTPLYLSPEQAKGTKIDQATDVYSLGAMAYEMFSGHVPFKADSAVEIMAMHISSPAEPLSAKAPWVPADVNHLILAMLEKDSRKRPTTAQVRETFAALHAAAQGRTTPIPFGMQTTPATPSPYGQQMTPSAPHSARTPYERPVTPPAGVPYQSSPYPAHPKPSAPQQSPYHQQPTPSTPQMSPYSTPATTIAPSSGGKRGLVIGGVVVAVLAVAAGAFFVMKKDKAPATAKEEPTQGSNVEVAVKDPTPTPPPPDPTPAGSDQGSAVAPPEGSAGSATPTDVTTKPDPVPEKPDPVKPDPPKMGRVSIAFAGPPKALVFIDGKAMGREASGKVSFSVSPGDHTIRVQAKGFKPAEQKIRVGAGGTESVKLTLEKRRTVNSVEDPFAD
jgi:serine/threonine-protein kinase